MVRSFVPMPYKKAVKSPAVSGWKAVTAVKTRAAGAMLSITPMKTETAWKPFALQKTRHSRG
ncbi:hypothetical protein LC724_22490 [Blautia sp. RD014234]|nr:hypothetical protein [Blautia parvula]